jgi:hypothetical protein
MLLRPARREYRTFTQDSRYWDVYRPRPSDIVIATPPKCGTTWMQQIVCSLVFQDPAPRALPGCRPAAAAQAIRAPRRTDAARLLGFSRSLTS